MTILSIYIVLALLTTFILFWISYTRNEVNCLKTALIALIIGLTFPLWVLVGIIVFLVITIQVYNDK
jgi:hypothetical protein